MADAVGLIETRIGRSLDLRRAGGPAAAGAGFVRNPNLPQVVAVYAVARGQTDRQHLAGNAGHDLQRIQKTGPGSEERQMEYAVPGRGDVFEDLDGGGGDAAGVGRYVHSGKRNAVDRHAHTAQRFGGHAGLGEIEVELIGSGTQWDLIDELAFAAAPE